MILGGIFQYLLKSGVLFHMPGTNVLWHGFTKWRPRAFQLLSRKGNDEVMNTIFASYTKYGTNNVSPNVSHV